MTTAAMTAVAETAVAETGGCGDNRIKPGYTTCCELDTIFLLLLI